MSLTFYTHPLFENKVKIVVYGPSPGRKMLKEQIGNSRLHPITERQFKEQREYAVYPSYLIVTVDGIEEIFEHREKGNILHITDEPSVMRK
jgi:hypothetical protein